MPPVYSGRCVRDPGATTEFDSEQLWTAAVIEFEREGLDSDLVTAKVTERRRSSAFASIADSANYSLTFTLPAPPTGATYEDINASVSNVRAGVWSAYASQTAASDFYGSSATVVTAPSVSTNESTTINADGSYTITVSGAINVGGMVTRHNRGGVPTEFTGWFRYFFFNDGTDDIYTFLYTVRVTIRLSYRLHRDTAILNEEVETGASEDLWGRRELTFPPWFSATSDIAVQERINAYAKPRDIHVVDFAMQQADSAMTDEIAAIQAGDFIGLLIDDPRTRTTISGFVFVMNVAYNLHRNRPPVKRLTCLQTGVAVVRNPIIFAVRGVELAINDVVLAVNG